ncbi:hypothetical protein BDD12DRAFT_835294 [Trichophaea hybrida]|nr:hypothetical protein BDD12DRAFT_835294 [Trichophaea hybrida]
MLICKNDSSIPQSPLTSNPTFQRKHSTGAWQEIKFPTNSTSFAKRNGGTYQRIHQISEALNSPPHRKRM